MPREESPALMALLTRKELKKTIGQFIKSFKNRLHKNLGDKIECVFLTGSYARGTYSTQSPNLNIFIISKPNQSGKLFLSVSKIFYELKDEFEEKLNLRVGLKPWRFALYTPKKNKTTLSVDMAVFDAALKKINFGVKNYIVRGWKSAYKVILGTDALKDLDIKVADSQQTIKDKRIYLIILKNQLMRMPTTYDWRKTPEFLFDESYNYGKLLLYEGLLFKMSPKEIESGLDLKLIDNKSQLINFYKERYSNEVGILAKRILEAREYYLKWKDSVEKATEIYNTAWKLWEIIWKTFLEATSEQLVRKI